MGPYVENWKYSLNVPTWFGIFAVCRKPADPADAKQVVTDCVKWALA